jgi:exonuclease VII large subunit
MDDKKFLFISLMLSLIGLFALVLIATFSAPPVMQIEDLENSIGKVVAIKADVAGISYKPDVVFLNLGDSSGEIKAVFFGDPGFDLIRGDEVAVKGKVQVYRGDLEIVIQELRCLSC